MLEHIMNEIIIYSKSCGLGNSFYLHKSPNLGKENGIEIMKLLNLEAGQKIGEVKKYIEEAILNGDIENTYDAALELLLKNKNKFI